MSPPSRARPGRRPSPLRAKPAQPTPCEQVEHGCLVGDLFRILGKAHMLDILAMFIHEGPGPRRFVDVQTRLRISPNTLSERLRELVEAGLLTRTAYNEIPPRVDYEATVKALDLRPVFDTLHAWASRHNLGAAEVAEKAAA